MGNSKSNLKKGRSWEQELIHDASYCKNSKLHHEKTLPYGALQFENIEEDYNFEDNLERIEREFSIRIKKNQNGKILAKKE